MATLVAMVAELLSGARDLLARGDTAAAAVCLRAALKLEPSCLEAHNLIEQHRLAGNFGEWTGLDCVISPRDDIFRYFANHPTSTNPLRDYLCDGWRTSVELMQVLEAHGLALSKIESFLEFASGHGRFTRHLVRLLPLGALHVSDVVANAVEFAKQQFGVDGFCSNSQPELIKAPRRYEVVFVLSLFSHLPPSSWAKWLARLMQLAQPGGLLIFSTHGEASAAREGVSMPSEGCHFVPSSESTALSADEYGCTYATEAYVRAVIRSALGKVEVRHFGAHFWGYQDAYALRAT